MMRADGWFRRSMLVRWRRLWMMCWRNRGTATRSLGGIAGAGGMWLTMCSTCWSRCYIAGDVGLLADYQNGERVGHHLAAGGTASGWRCGRGSELGCDEKDAVGLAVERQGL